MERTLVLIKPDAVQRGLIGELIGRFERRGIRVVALKMLQVPRELAEQHYSVHKGKPFYDSLIAFITSAPVVAMALEGEGIIAVVRKTMGTTRSAQAEPGTIRGDLAVSTQFNLVHGSDGPETAAAELSLWFSEDEFCSWERSVEPWIIE